MYISNFGQRHPHHSLGGGMFFSRNGDGKEGYFEPQSLPHIVHKISFKMDHGSEYQS